LPLARIPEYGETIGKKFPAVGPFRNYKPNIIGPGSGKLKALIEFGKFVASNPFIAGGIGGIAIGTGVALDGLSTQTVEGGNQFKQTLRPSNEYYRSYRSSSKSRYRKKRSGACHCKCV